LFSNVLLLLSFSLAQALTQYIYYHTSFRAMAFGILEPASAGDYVPGTAVLEVVSESSDVSGLKHAKEGQKRLNLV
jgi:hypothetical protein